MDVFRGAPVGRDEDRRRALPELGSPPRVVIVGAGFAGLEVARGLGKAPVRVTVIDRSNHFLFQPLLYQVATAGLSPAEISAPIRAALRRQANTQVLLAEVTGIDISARAVRARDVANGRERCVPYEYLVLATGAGPSYFGHDEWARFAPGLKTIADATAIRRHVLLAFEAAEMEPDGALQRALLTFVVVGGGPTGVELASAIAELARRSMVADFRHISAATARIILVEAQQRILPSFAAPLASHAEAQLRRLGVEVRTHAPVQRVDADSLLIDGVCLPARTILWAAGVRASPAGAWLGAAMDRAGRVIVQDDLTLCGHAEVYIIGDTANAEQAGCPLPAIAPVAMQEGRYVALALRRRLAGLPVQSFSYHDKGDLVTVGRGYAIARIGALRFSGSLAWLLWVGTHIFYLIGFRNRVLVLLQWAWAYVTSQRGARLITPEPSGGPEQRDATMTHS